MALQIRPISLAKANAFVNSNHRHNKAVTGQRFSIACYDGDKLCGVAICGNPIARKLDDGLTLEIRRVCTDGTRNACSMLYGACCRIGKNMGFQKIITYTLQSENGASLRASNFKLVAENCGGTSWNSPSRPREEEQITLFGKEKKYSDELKKRWEITFYRKTQCTTFEKYDATKG